MGDDDAPGERDASSDRDETVEDVCAYCEGPIDTSEWYPVTTERDAEGSLEFYYFCCEDCRKAWLDEPDR